MSSVLAWYNDDDKSCLWPFLVKFNYPGQVCWAIWKVLKTIAVQTMKSLLLILSTAQLYNEGMNCISHLPLFLATVNLILIRILKNNKGQRKNLIRGEVQKRERREGDDVTRMLVITVLVHIVCHLHSPFSAPMIAQQFFGKQYIESHAYKIQLAVNNTLTLTSHAITFFLVSGTLLAHPSITGASIIQHVRTHWKVLKDSFSRNWDLLLLTTVHFLRNWDLLLLTTVHFLRNWDLLLLTTVHFLRNWSLLPLTTVHFLRSWDLVLLTKIHFLRSWSPLLLNKVHFLRSWGLILLTTVHFFSAYHGNLYIHNSFSIGTLPPGAFSIHPPPYDEFRCILKNIRTLRHSSKWSTALNTFLYKIQFSHWHFQHQMTERVHLDK